MVILTGVDLKAVVESTQYNWDVRNKFTFVAPTTSFDESMTLALKSKSKPYIISDMGDNPTS